MPCAVKLGLDPVCSIEMSEFWCCSHKDQVATLEPERQRHAMQSRLPPNIYCKWRWTFSICPYYKHGNGTKPFLKAKLKGSLLTFDPQLTFLSHACWDGWQFHQVPKRQTLHTHNGWWLPHCVAHWETTVTNKPPLHPRFVLSCIRIMRFCWHDVINAAANLATVGLVGSVYACSGPTHLCICLHRLLRSKVKWFNLLCAFAPLTAHSCMIHLALAVFS